ncbi:MAG: hypothetical protein JWO89_682 [Verrucomicrobiaceae bacterium]|nr:hypothetical protein [Verrucomicrobiaceae bacterium]
MSAFQFRPCLILLLTAAFCVAAAAGSDSENLRLAGLYLKLGKVDQCRAAVEQVLRSNPSSVEGLVLLSKLELKQSNQTAALNAADAALAFAPDNINATIVKARVLTAQGRNAEAQKMLALVPADELERHEAELEGLIAVKEGVTSLKEKDDPQPDVEDKAADALDEILEEARHALALHQFNKAEMLVKKALRLSPDNKDAVLLRADILSECGHSEQAVGLLQKLKAQTTGPFPDELALASALQDAGREEEARLSFQIVAHGSNYSDDDRKQARAALAAIELQKSLTEGDKELDAGHAEKALALAEVALKIEPKNEEALSLKGRALVETGHPHEAVDILRLLKTSTPIGKRFDAQSDYASALSLDRQYYESFAAYQEIQDQPDLYKDEERTSAKEQITELRDNSLAAGNVEFTAGSFEEGLLLRSESHFSTARFGRLRYSLDTDWEHVKLDHRVFGVRREEDRFTSAIGFNFAWNSQYSTDFHLGAYESGTAVGGSVIYHPSPRTTLSLHANYNNPARDSLLLMAMDGRQHDLTANITMPFGKHFLFESILQGRRIEVNGSNIGSSLGTETQIQWHPISNEDNLFLAYILEYKDFRGDQRAFDREAQSFLGRRAASMRDVCDAVPELINRHALQVHNAWKLTPSLTAEASAEIAWRQETKMREYGATAGLQWQVTTRTSLIARVEYYSGGAGPNGGAGVTLASLGAKWIW